MGKRSPSTISLFLHLSFSCLFLHYHSLLISFLPSFLSFPNLPSSSHPPFLCPSYYSSLLPPILQSPISFPHPFALSSRILHFFLHPPFHSFTHPPFLCPSHYPSPSHLSPYPSLINILSSFFIPSLLRPSVIHISSSFFSSSSFSLPSLSLILHLFILLHSSLILLFFFLQSSFSLPHPLVIHTSPSFSIHPSLLHPSVIHISSSPFSRSFCSSFTHRSFSLLFLAFLSIILQATISFPHPSRHPHPLSLSSTILHSFPHPPSLCSSYHPSLPLLPFILHSSISFPPPSGHPSCILHPALPRRCVHPHLSSIRRFCRRRPCH